jgi:hypothetical protein
VRFLLILLIAWSLGTCRSEVPEVPRAFEWTTWSGTVPVKIYLTDLEFRSDRELNPVNRRILASFTIISEAAD